MSVGTLYGAARRIEVGEVPAALELPHYERVDVVAGEASVEWRGETFSRRGRTHDVRRYDDDEIGLILLIFGGLRNNVPKTGTEPIQGSCDKLPMLLDCKRPAIAKLWPLRSSIVVRASRLVRDGMVVPEIVTAFE